MLWLKFMLMMSFYFLIFNELFRLILKYLLTDIERKDRYYKIIMKVSKILSIVTVLIVVILIILLETG